MIAQIDLAQHIYAAQLIDDALTDGYGADSAIFDRTLYQNVGLCLDEIESDIRKGQSTAGSVGAAAPCTATGSAAKGLLSTPGETTW